MRSTTVTALCFSLMIPITPSANTTAQLTGKVIGVADGDTVTVLIDGKRQVKIRLHGIDCPEKKQPFGKRAKQFTSKLVFGKTVTVKVVTIGKYGRTVGEVFIGNKSLNEELVNRLQLHRNRAFWSRIYTRLSLGDALPDDTAEYLDHRLKQAGCKRDVFSENAVALLHEAALGRLRDIDRLATAALKSASRRKRKIVDRAIITDVVERQTMTPTL